MPDFCAKRFIERANTTLECLDGAILNAGINVYSWDIVAPIAEDHQNSAFTSRCASNFLTSYKYYAMKNVLLTLISYKCPPASIGILSRLPSEVVQILMSMPGGSEDEWMRNEPTGDFQDMLHCTR